MDVRGLGVRRDPFHRYHEDMNDSGVAESLSSRMVLIALQRDVGVELSGLSGRSGHYRGRASPWSSNQNIRAGRSACAKQKNFVTRFWKRERPA